MLSKKERKTIKLNYITGSMAIIIMLITTIVIFLKGDKAFIFSGALALYMGKDLLRYHLEIKEKENDKKKNS